MTGGKNSASSRTNLCVSDNNLISTSSVVLSVALDDGSLCHSSLSVSLTLACLWVRLRTVITCQIVRYSQFDTEYSGRVQYVKGGCLTRASSVGRFKRNPDLGEGPSKNKGDKRDKNNCNLLGSRVAASQ